MAALPFSPVKFSGLIERDWAAESRWRFPRFISRPLKPPPATGPWASAARATNPNAKPTR